MLLGTCNAVIIRAACGFITVIFVPNAAQAFPVQDAIKPVRDLIRYVNGFRVSSWNCPVLVYHFWVFLQQCMSSLLVLLCVI